jgi:fibronectin type 3 domain-containing protein
MQRAVLACAILLSSNAPACANPPSAPTNLTASAATGGLEPVTLAWTASASATGYNVYRGTFEIGSTASVGFSDSAASAGVSNSYAVTAVDSGGTSAASSPAIVTLAPASPLNLIATGSSNQVILNWSASTGATVYRVFRSTTSGGEANPAYAAGLGSPGYTDTAAAGGATYFYKVTAVNTGGASGFSSETSATIAPAAPTNLTATAASGGVAPVTLAWTARPIIMR